RTRMQIVRSLGQWVVIMVVTLGAIGLSAVTSSAQSGFSSGSTGADGALVFYTPPAARYGHAMVYDTVRQRVVLFGGQSSSGRLNESWEYDGTSWTERNLATAPDARYQHAMAYDAARQRVVLFGGDPATSGTLNETWEYDGTSWTRIT